MSRLKRRRIILFLLFLGALLYVFSSRGMLDWQELFNEGPRRGHWRNQFLDSYKETGQMLLFKPPGSDYVPAESLGDDEGFYLAYVWADSLGLSDNRTHTYWLLTVTPALAYFLLLIPMGRGHPRRPGYLAAVVAATLLALSTLDVYVFVVLPAAMFMVLLLRRDQHATAWYRGFLCTFAVVCALTEQVRSHTGLIFFLLLLGYCLYKKRGWFALLALGLTYFFVTYLYNSELDRLRQNRDVWYQQYSGTEVADLYPGETLTSHAVWHNVYLGLGFDGINGVVYHDTYAAAQVGRKIQGRAIEGGFYPIDTVYEETLKRLYWDAVLSEPFRALWMYFKKFILTASFVLLFSGLLFERDLGLSRLRPKNDEWRAENVLLLTACFVLMAPGVIALPQPIFFLGSVACAPGFFLLGPASED